MTKGKNLLRKYRKINENLGVGSSAYCAPEILINVRRKKDLYNEKVDVWALGLVIHSIVMDQLPPWDDWEDEKIETQLQLPHTELAAWLNSKLKYSKVPSQW